MLPRDNKILHTMGKLFLYLILVLILFIVSYNIFLWIWHKIYHSQYYLVLLSVGLIYFLVFFIVVFSKRLEHKWKIRLFLSSVSVILGAIVSMLVALKS